MQKIVQKLSDIKGYYNSFLCNCQLFNKFLKIDYLVIFGVLTTWNHAWGQ